VLNRLNQMGMEAIIGLSFLFAIWLTLLTMKIKEQRREIDGLRKNNKFYLKELTRISNEQDKTKEGQTGETD
jgi:hypothetical protein